MTCQCENVEFGSYDNQIEVEAPTHMKGMEIGCLTIKETICLDKCVAEEVMSLWTLGIITTGCCCGHNKLHGYIGVYGAESIRMMKKLGYKIEPGRTDHFIAQYKPTTSISLAQIPDSVCDCPTCQAMCQHRPCWPTPEEAQTLIDKGYSDRLMSEWYDLPGEVVELLVPARQGAEGQRAPFYPVGSCTFFKDGKCELHSLGLKPIEGRKAICTQQNAEHAQEVHKQIVNTWDNPEAASLCKSWRDMFNVQDNCDANILDVFSFLLLEGGEWAEDV